MNLLEVPLADLLRVLPFKAHDDVRYYINGILVTPYNGGALLVATNGHWMAIYESKAARTDKDRILDIPHWFARQIRRMEANEPAYDSDEDDFDDGDTIVPHASSGTSGLLTVATADSRLTITQQEAELLVKPGKPFIDGTFPDWRRILPAPSDIAKGLLAPVAASYLSGLTRAVPKDHNHPLFCYHQPKKPDGAALFRFGGIPELVIALMPRRDADKEPDSWPIWMQAAQKEAAA